MEHKEKWEVKFDKEFSFTKEGIETIFHQLNIYEKIKIFIKELLKQEKARWEIDLVQLWKQLGTSDKSEALLKNVAEESAKFTLLELDSEIEERLAYTTCNYSSEIKNIIKSKYKRHDWT